MNECEVTGNVIKESKDKEKHAWKLVKVIMYVLGRVHKT
jgi:hypothetical protein